MLGRPKLAADFGELLSTCERPTIMDLTLLLAGAQGSLRQLWRQWVCGLSDIVEDCTLVAHGSKEAPAAHANRPEGQSAQPLDHLADAELDAGRKVLAYYLAARRVFNRQRFLGFACDFTRVGKRAVANAFITTPGNIGAWAPPQVRWTRADRCRGGRSRATSSDLVVLWPSARRSREPRRPAPKGVRSCLVSRRHLFCSDRPCVS